MSTDTTIMKVSSKASPRGEMGQAYLASGKHVSMRLWDGEKPQETTATKRDYETVGYCISGKAELDLAGQTVRIEAGNSWLVPAGTVHRYRISEPFTAVEATSPPAQVHARDAGAPKT